MRATRIVGHPSLTLPSASSHPTPSPPHALRNTLHIKPGIFSWKKLLDRKRRSDIFRLCTWRNFPRKFCDPSNPKISWKNFLVRNGLSVSVTKVHVCMVTHIARVWIIRVRLPILLVVSWTGKMNISLSAFAPENLVSRDGFGSPVPHQPAHLHTQAESGAYLRDSSRFPRRRPFICFKSPYAIESVPS